ncbi:MAG TPA: hypothetical protein PLX17_00600 [Chitinophagaceae bacterium]|nr:hypothetical protein [Chitinophagaceae bacterium]
MNTSTANNEQLAVIDQKKDLVHLDELVTEITDLKNDYKDLSIEGPEDKDGYEKVRAAIGVLRPKRTGLEAERKSVVKPYNDFVKHINSQYEKITDLITDGPGGETELKAKKEAVDEILEREKEAKRLEEEKKINDRINELISNGLVFDGQYYSIKDEALGISETSIGVVEVRTMSDDLFKQFLQLVIDKAGKIAAERERVAALEKKQQEEKAAAEKKEREEFEANKKKLDEQFAAMKKQQDDIKAAQEKLDADKREAEQKEKQVEQERINGIIRHRSAILTSIGLQYNSAARHFDYNGEVLVSDADGIAGHDDTAWLGLVETLKTTIAKKKLDAEEFLKEQQKKEKEKLDLLEKERLAGLSDKQKMQEYIDALYNVPVPDLKTKTWKAKVGTVRDFITDNRPV